MSWAHYILQVNIYLLLFYCFYRILLAKETYFLCNRIYLVASGLLSLTIPFLRFEWLIRQEATQKIYMGVDHINYLVTQASFSNSYVERFNWGAFIIWIYLIGIVFLTLRLIFRLSNLKKLSANVARGQAFSFLNKKRVDPKLPANAVIHKHEDIHIQQLHTIDVLFFELLAIFAWFNPVIYLYKTTIKSIHEYLADEKAATYQGNKEEYALLLLSKAFNVEPHMLTNNFFNQSLLKQRIFMLHKQRSKKTAILKYGLFVPLFGLTLVLSAATIRENQKIIAVADKLPITETIINSSLLQPASKTPNQPILISGVRLKKSRNWSAFYSHLTHTMQYPVAAAEAKVQGNVTVNFSIKAGATHDIAVNRRIGYGCDVEAMKAVANYANFEQMPDGKYAIQLLFRISGSNSTLVNKKNEPANGHQMLKNIYITTSPQSTIPVPVLEEPVTDTDVNALKIRLSAAPDQYPGIVKVVDGKVISSKEFSELNADHIHDIAVWKGAIAKDIYGNQAKNGAIIITTNAKAPEAKGRAFRFNHTASSSDVLVENIPKPDAVILPPTPTKHPKVSLLLTAKSKINGAGKKVAKDLLKRIAPPEAEEKGTTGLHFRVMEGFGNDK